MARSHTRSPRLSISKSMARVRVRSPSLQRKKTSFTSSIESDRRVDQFLSTSTEEIDYGEGSSGNKVMVVVDDLSLDAKGPLEWALSHAVQNHDNIFLLYVAKSSKLGNQFHSSCFSAGAGKLNLRAYEKLHCMKNICQMRKPGVQVELVMVEGKEKGAIIVKEAKKHKVSLLVLGQRKKSIVWRFMRRWSSKKKAVGGIVDYCIQNSSCMTIAVRRKSTQFGGYLITTKRHKNFWLLA
ncbi:hypothetical protein JRO89_XS13G0006100 [Xanthoceras sorbifolium]|uniref:UspA domain-containing protein n=1 Tax=Xanthoceras sorbifolium TaxID=99658 RepID=A0ABQ8H5V4_9ROSI|nr:hypothetical protein JRO89_XS13G0006100 [Xanthoceras sorbifolium]